MFWVKQSFKISSAYLIAIKISKINLIQLFLGFLFKFYLDFAFRTSDEEGTRIGTTLTPFKTLPFESTKFVCKSVFTP